MPVENKYDKQIKIYISKADKDTVFNQVLTIFKNLDFSIPKSKKANREDFHLDLGINDNYYRWVIRDTERAKLPIEFKNLLDGLNKSLKERQ